MSSARSIFSSHSFKTNLDQIITAINLGHWSNWIGHRNMLKKVERFNSLCLENRFGHFDILHEIPKTALTSPIPPTMGPGLGAILRAGWAPSWAAAAGLPETAARSRSARLFSTEPASPPNPPDPALLVSSSIPLFRYSSITVAAERFQAIKRRTSGGILKYIWAQTRSSHSTFIMCLIQWWYAHLKLFYQHNIYCLSNFHFMP